MQIPFSLQLSASGRSHGFIAFLPLMPVRLKYLKSEELLPEPTTLTEHIKKWRLDLKLTVKEAGKLWERTSRRSSSGKKVARSREYTASPRLSASSVTTLCRNAYHFWATGCQRLERGWSRKVASRSLGIDVSTLRDWEQGKVILFRKHRRLVAEVLGIPESELDAGMKARWKNAHGQTGVA
jgi:ribosome-binding protein aMBF1 (putative translation factor)